jgi:hypothetical protein
VAGPALADINDAWNWTERQADGAWKGTKRAGGHFFGYGNETQASFACNDPRFFMILQEDEASNEQSWLLKGVVNTPTPGFTYQFRFFGTRTFEAFTGLMVGQPLAQPHRQERGSPEPRVVVEQRFKMPKQVSVVHVRVEGLTQVPTEFLCDVTPPTVK